MTFDNWWKKKRKSILEIISHDSITFKAAAIKPQFENAWLHSEKNTLKKIEIKLRGDQP